MTRSTVPARRLRLPPGTVESAAAMEALGAGLADQLQPGDVLALSGDLGTGKTTLVRGLAARLGVEPEAVASPTFALVHLYQGDVFSILHADFYRIDDPGEIEAAGILEQLEDPELLSIVEWPGIACDLLPAHTIWLELSMDGLGRRVVQPPA